MAKRRKHAAGSGSSSGDIAKLNVHIFHEVQTKDGCERTPIKDATVRVFDECGEHELTSEVQLAHKEGRLELSLTGGHVYRIVPQLPASEGCPALYTPLAGGFLVDARDQHCEIPIQYYSRPGEARASACEHDDDDPAAGAPHPGVSHPAGSHPAGSHPMGAHAAGSATEPAYLPNVTFSLYRGIGVASGKLQSFTTKEHCPEAIFENLAPGYYTLVAEMPPDSNYEPCCTTQVFHVCEGQCVDLTCCFCFHHATGDVTLSVTDDCGNPMPDVPVVLSGPNGTIHPTTVTGGDYSFASVPVGTYKVKVPGNRHVAGDGVKWESTAPDLAVHVGASATPATATLRLQRLIHRIDIVVTDARGKPQANAVVCIMDKSKTNVIDTVVLDAKGKYTWTAPTDEQYYFGLKPAQGVAPARLFTANGKTGT